MLSLWIILFQLGLALGLPLGVLTMGGLHPGALPPGFRLVALTSALLLAGAALLVMKVARGRLSRRSLWPLAGILCFGLAANLATPSPPERGLWAPVMAVMLACVLRLASRP